MRILVTDGMDKTAMAELKAQGHEVVEQFYESEELGKALRGFDVVVVRSKTKVRAPHIDEAKGSNLKLIIRGGVGVDNIDVKYAEAAGITVKNTPRASSQSVAELAMAHMFACARFVSIAGHTMREGKWEKKAYGKGIELQGKTLGIVGFGRIGQHLGVMAKAIGMKVIAFGRISVFPRDGAYQLYCSELSVEGVGDLHVAFEQLKEKLFKEGLFAPEHKKPLPKYPKRIAIITSSAGAAVHDMLRILNARWPMSEVVLLPVRVQGAEAPPEIAGALRYANKWQVADLIITGRGGGSIEDLWAFNDERVARAIYASDIPVISAVGHEPDVTIADFVADARASTPSNAAEIAVPDQEELRRRLGALQTRMDQSERKRVKNLREQFEKTARSRVLQDPMAFIDDKRLLLDYTQKNLASLARQQTAQRMQQFASLAAKLDALSPLSVLGRGYAVARTEDGQILRAAQDVSVGEKVEVLLGQGSLNCTVNACNMGGNDDGKNV